MMHEIQELKNNAVKSDVSTSELLRHAKIIAQHKDKKFLRWLEKELNGYKEDDKLPEYRMVSGEPRAWNPYRGWIPFLFENPKAQEAISKRGVIQSLAELEKLTSKDVDHLEMPYGANIQKSFSKGTGMQTKYSLLIAINSVDGILNIVRNMLIDWLIKVDVDKFKTHSSENTDNDIFPDELIKKLPKDIKILADDFNFNFSCKRPKTCLLILRRILPLSIVRKFQKENRESELKDTNGDYLQTKKMLGKTQNMLSQSRIYSGLVTYKILTDGSQHSYTLNIQISDACGAAIALRVFLDDIF